MVETGTMIDYSLRSRKYVERKIFGELFQAVNNENKTISDYRYIGLGSFYFSDFIMMHEVFGINDCICFTKNSRWYYDTDEITAIIINEIFKICNNGTGVTASSGFDLKKCSELSKMIRGDRNIVKQKANDFISLCQAKYGEFGIDGNFYDDLNKKLKSKFTNRYEFNKPFDCIDIIYGDINTCYGKLPKKKEFNDITWLDYDKFLSTNGIELIKNISNKSKVGDILIITVALCNDPKEFIEKYNNILCPDEICSSDEDSENYCDDSNLVSTEKIDDSKVNDKTDIPKCVYELLNKIISDELDKRRNPITMHEVLNCTYQDGRYMYTYAVVFDNEDSKIISKIKGKEWYTKKDNTKDNMISIYNIDVPCMTSLERRKISQYLPTSDLSSLETMFPFIDEEDIEKYISIYRYYPNFIPAESKA